MHHPEEAPPIPIWPFLAGDVLLLATASLIFSQAPTPLAAGPLTAIFCCVGLGAMLLTLPFLLNHTRQQENLLTERERALSALAQTTATSAEQISIAASSLHSIAENSIRAFKLAEQLPQKMQEKINEFKSQLNEVAVTENESLSQEINTLRSSETERLETALGAVRKLAADLAAVEASSRKHFAEISEQLTRSLGSAKSSAADSAKTIEAARAAAEKSLIDAQHAAAASLEACVDTTTARLESTFATLSSRLAAQAETLHPQEAKTSLSPRGASEASPSPTLSSDTGTYVTPAAASNPADPSPVAETVDPAPLRDQPAQMRAETNKPFKNDAAGEDASSAQDSAAIAVLPAEERPPRKRGPRKSAQAEAELSLGIEFERPSDYSQVAPDESTPAVSADGFTRLVVTAYIGIGNKLFVRGEGPGLSWDRGVPLQFISIGKWRWETADAIAPVTLKLFKNDEQECAALGSLTLAPGHQQDVRASFT